MDTNTAIRAIVDKHEAIYRGDSPYNNAITDMTTIDLANISQSDVVDVVEPFLYDWGKMGRVLGQERFSGWQGKVTNIIRSNSGILKQFQNRNIEYENLSNHRHEIAMLYESFKAATGQIASAKILNLICPNFFPLWDNGIANAVRVELAHLEGCGFDKSIEVFSGADYLRFMEGIKLFISRHSDVLLLLSNQYQQRKLRIIDECFWWIVRRPFFLIF
jgi:hypothetical protein